MPHTKSLDWLKPEKKNLGLELYLIFILAVGNTDLIPKL